VLRTLSLSLSVDSPSCPAATGAADRTDTETTNHKNPFRSRGRLVAAWQNASDGSADGMQAPARCAGRYGRGPTQSFANARRRQGARSWAFVRLRPAWCPSARSKS